MRSYRVRVFKMLLSSDGHSFKCPQFENDIAHAKSAQRAIEAARCRYERRRRLPDWRSIADLVEASDVEMAAAKRQPILRRSGRPRREPAALLASGQNSGHA